MKKQIVPVVMYGRNNLATVIGEAEVEITEMKLGHPREDYVFGALVMMEVQKAPVPVDNPKDEVTDGN